MKCARLFLVAATFCVTPPSFTHADSVSATASLSSTVRPSGPRSGTNGTNFFNVEGSNNGTNASYGVLDFTSDSFNLAFTATSISNLSLSLTEANSAFTTAFGGLSFYLVTDTTTSITSGTSPLVYDSSLAPEGLGTQLGATPFLLGTGNFSANSGNNGSGDVDTYTLSLDSDAQTYFLSQLNTNGAILRLVITPTDATGASTWAGSTSTSTHPTLSFSVILDQPSLIWGGGNGTWNATGGSDWSGDSWDSTKTAVFNTGAGNIILGTPVSAVGLIFNTTGYTVSGSDTNTLSLDSGAGGNVITVTNASDTAIVSAEVAGTSGLIKSGAGTLALTGANSFTGDVAINGGTLAVLADANLGNASNGIVLATGTLKSTAAFTVGSSRTLSGSGIIDSSAGALTFSGSVNATALTLTNNSSVAFSGASAAFSSAALGNGSMLTISAPITSASRTTFSGDGTVKLNGDNSAYLNGFTMSKGAGSVGPTVVLASATALGAPVIGQPLFFNAGGLQASTDLTGENAIATGISVGGNVSFSGSDMEFTGAFGFFGTTLRTLTVTNHTIISSSITGVGNAQDILIKAGTGTLTLMAANGYSFGTQILAGTLEVGPAGALGTGNVTVSSGATLLLENNISIDDLSNLFLLAGESSFGILDLDFDSSLFETVNTLTVNGVALPAGTYNATNLSDYITGSGNLIVTAVPEPQVMLFLLGAGMLLVALPSARRRFCNR